MKYRTLGKSGLKVSVIGMGTWQFGGEWGKIFTQVEATAMFRRALELGINLIDTAECYGDHLSEQFIGQAITDLGGPAVRDRFLIATKFGHHFLSNFNRAEPRSPQDIEKQLDDSLRALQTHYIDLYQYHSWRDSESFNNDIRAVLERARDAGKIRHIGNSLAASQQTTVQVEKAPDFHVEAIQVVYNRLQRQAEDKFFPIAERLKLGVLARVPLASGFLSGKYKPGDKFPENDVRTQWQSETADERIAEAHKIAQAELPPGIPMARWALAWCLKSPAVQCVIPGCKSVQQVEDNALAADLDLVSEKHPWAAK